MELALAEFKDMGNVCPEYRHQNNPKWEKIYWKMVGFMKCLIFVGQLSPAGQDVLEFDRILGHVGEGTHWDEASK